VKVTNKRRQKGFTLVEIMVGMALGTIVLGAIVAAAISLNRTFAAVDNFFSTHLQQVRIIDYLNRDVKRSNIAEISANAQTIYCWVPKYVIEPGDTDPKTARSPLSRRARISSLTRSPTSTWPAAVIYPR
jgi:prepilin-type N-terminal cleavage/methylation domain-containing protein